ncbi:MAG TPA: hypothetical protein VFL62_20785 [Bradyrhizobium sp.]|uniref:hypothetical protein n=1 Tax=Bradyrhizobium sp. TaxID=376 RepID=UPI002D7E9B3E|nr:hypothetical protein [Bradyrhizobium sp.]HET7888668.1 hypothetical protein [Bradyrhizobium sp.]
MRTKILTMIGAVSLVSLTAPMAVAAEHHMRAHRAPIAAQEQFRDSNAYYAGPDEFYAAPDSYAYAVRPYRWMEEQDEAAMTSGIAGH